MTTYKGLTVEINAETKGLTSALREASKGASATAKELKQVENALKFNPDSARLTTRQMELLSDKVEEATKRLKVLKQAEEQIGKSGMSTDQWTKLQAEIATTESKLDNFKRKLSELQVSSAAQNTALGRMGTALTNFGDRYQTLGSTLQNAGQTLTSTVTPALLGIGGAAIVAATNIDTSLTNVRKTVDGTEQQYEQLKDAAIEFSKTNAVSASQILDIQALGAQLGFSIDELQEFGEVVSGLDIATNMDAETAATNLAQFANITRMSHDEISNYASAIVGLGNNFATTESDISNMAMRIASAGTQAGMSQADILGLSTALSSLGMEAEAGGSAISTIITNIDKAVATNSESLGTWAETAGMSAQQFAEAWKSDPVEALADVLSGMQQATEEGGNMATMLEELDITELRQSDAMRRMAGNADLVSEAVATANSEWEKNTALGTEVENRNDSLAAKFEMLKNRVLAVAEDIGGALADALFAAIDAMEPLFQGIENGAKAFSNMSTQQQAAIIQAVALVAALGPLLRILGTIPSLATGLGTALTTAAKGIQAISSGTGLAAAGLTTLRSGIIGVVAALAMLGIGLAVKAWSDYNAHIETVAQATDGLASSTEAMGGAYESAYSAAENAATGNSDYVMSLGEMSSMVDGAIQSNAALADELNSIYSEAGTAVGQLDYYRDTISDLAGRSDLTAGQVTLLEDAIARVNEMCGTNYSVVQDAGGAYQIMSDGATVAKDAILELIEAQKLQLQLEANKEAYTSAYEELGNRARELAEAQKTLAQETSNYEEAMSKGAYGTNSLGESVQEAQGDMEAAQARVDEFTASYLEQADVCSQAEDNITAFAAAQELAAGSTARLVAENTMVNATLDANGQSLNGFINDLQAAGVNQEQFAALGADKMVELAQAYNGSFSSIQGKLTEFGVGFDEAAAKALIDAQQISSAITQAIQGNQEWSVALANAGVNIGTFSTQLANLGITARDLTGMNAQQMQLLAENSQAGAQAIINAFDQANVHLPDSIRYALQQSITAAQQAVEQFRLAGSAEAQAWAQGLSQGGMNALYATSQLTGLSLDQLYAAQSQYQLAGDGAIQAWCSAIQMGAEPSAAAAAVMGGMTLDTLNSFSTQFGEQAGVAIAAYCTEIQNGATQSEASAAALSAATEAGYESPDFASKTEQATQENSAAAASGDTSGASTYSDNMSESYGTPDFATGTTEGISEANAAAASGDTSGAQTWAQSYVDAANSAMQQLGSLDIAGALSGPFTAAQDAATTAGETTGGNFASGVSGKSGDTSSAAQAHADATSAMNSNSGSAFGWGSSLGSNFAAGILSQLGAVQAATAQLAAAAALPIEHSTPKYGPLRDDDEWGGHLADNFAEGITSGTPKVAKASLGIAQTVADYIGHTQPAKGPLSVGEWVFGWHTAINYAEGLYSGVDDVGSAAGELSEAVEDELSEGELWLQEYLAKVEGLYSEHKDHMAGAMADLTDEIWQAWSVLADDEWVRPFTGNVYESMKAIEEAGYDLDSWKDKLAQAAEEQVEWQRKLEDLDWDTREQEKKKAEADEWDEFDQRSYDEWMRNRQDTLDEYAEWLAEFESLKALESSLSASTAEMEEWADLYKMKSDVISMTDESERLADALWNAGLSGATFSQEFIDYIADNGPEAVHALEQLTDMGKDDLQALSDSFRDAALAEREAELNMRSLYVNSLKYTDFSTPESNLLDFLETVLDVREAIYSDAGLSSAFEKTGTYAEGFAMDLESLNMSMEEFQSYYDGFTKSVTNGFQLMANSNMTSLADWESNLKQNAAIAQDWASDLREVFEKVGYGAETEAFRQAVLEGGYEQWGRVIDEMADLNEDQLTKLVSQYNASMRDAQLAGLEAFKALAPGEEYVNSIVDGILNKQEDLDGTMVDASDSANDAMLGTAPEWYSTGSSLAHEIATGIQSQITSIAQAAAQTVRSAIEAARQEAGDADQATIPGGGYAGSTIAASARSLASAATALSAMPAMASVASRATQAVRSVTNNNQTVNMTFNVTTRPGQTVDVRELAKEINKVQERAFRARGNR